MAMHPDFKMSADYAENARKVINISKARREALQAASDLERHGMEFRADLAREFADDCSGQIELYRHTLLDPELYSDIPF